MVWMDYVIILADRWGGGLTVYVEEISTHTDLSFPHWPPPWDRLTPITTITPPLHHLFSYGGLLLGRLGLQGRWEKFIVIPSLHYLGGSQDIGPTGLAGRVEGLVKGVTSIHFAYMEFSMDFA